ncbi:serine/arginine repetitive matrix protein 1 [Cylas formicarius]|uniref:serine/arginine repetitive matrix protein 1 n=1 Tax=Cylas formicarius TaxID=197179 RepID=UPI002958B0B9|nr:serine/arginine repetitive matrix protein 1 [Cylas formicarius]
MKRPPGLWILLSAGVLWLSLQDVYGIRATALIFAKTTTSTTTAEPSSVSPASADEETVAVAEVASTSTNSTNETLTGIPQIDYVWDPNLPKELNGYNLSEYPFYERVPEEIDFKCDGLHDGFYASVPHKCQVYHHCLFGTRYDFLCANYTAFDQKTFICHFVSEVDCQNSKKFWHRNDALYTVTTTTTLRPIRLDIYTPPPQAGDPVTPLPSASAPPRRPPEARRPYRPNRRRPQFDYYEDEYYDDEYYEERPRRNRGRKRPRPRRPVYDDDYEEYEDERYERRGSGRRRPYRRRNKGRRKPEYEDEEVEERFEDADFVAANKRHRNEDRVKNTEDDRVEDRERKRPKTEKRRYPEDAENERKSTRKGVRKPSGEDYEDEFDDSRTYEGRRRKENGKKQPGTAQDNDDRPVIKPISGSIYDRPRLAPRINLPVPKNVADKFSYNKSAGGSKSSTIATVLVEENYSDYEEDVVPKSSKDQEIKSDENKEVPNNNTNNDSRGQAASTQKQKVRRPENEQTPERTTIKPKYGSGRPHKYAPNRSTSSTTKKPVIEEYDDEYEYEVQEIKQKNNEHKNERTSTTISTTTTSTTEVPPPKERSEPIVRIVKRPFLPSRGGNPYLARGLQPVGLKAADKKNIENDSNSNRQGQSEKTLHEDFKSNQETSKSDEERKSAFKASPIIIKVPIRSKYIASSPEAQEVFDSESSRQQNYKKEFPSVRTTEKTFPGKNALDLNEYDVTLNEALSPTLPNVPVRSYPTGFSAGSDYSYSAYQRPRYVADSIISPSDVYQNQPVRQQQHYERIPQSQYINGGYSRREVSNGQTQAIYSSY